MPTAWFESLWRDDRRLRYLLLVVNAGLTYFWVYSVAYIIEHPIERGSDGFEIFLAIPMTAIAILLSMPAQILVIWNKTLRISALVSMAAIAANAAFGISILWNSMLRQGPYWPIW